MNKEINTVRVLRIGLISCSGILMTLMGCGICGCAFKKPQLFHEYPHVHESEMPSWEEGMRAFQCGEYDRALKLYETLSQEAEDETLRRRTLYALACIRLIRARDLWSRFSSVKLSDEDHRMLAPLLKEIALLKPGKDPGNDQTCKNLLLAKEKEIEDIRHQIEALETIHREIQEKKKEVSSP